MATLNQIIFNIKNLKGAGRQSDDDSISDSQYAFILSYYREQLLTQQLQKGYTINDDLIQDLGRVKIAKVKEGECGEIKGGCIYKVIETLPKFVDMNGTPLVKYLGTENGRAFQRTSYREVQFTQNLKYTGKMEKWFQIGENTYIYSPKASLGTHIAVRGVLSDPVQGNDYRCNNEGCDSGYDFQYPIPLKMLDTIYKMMIDAELRLSMTKLQDTSNDSKDN
jgi:hypothetical protein